MSKVYLITFGFGVDQQVLANFFDSDATTQDWFYCMPNSLFIVSTLALSKINEKITIAFPSLMFVTTEVSGKTVFGGRMPNTIWKRFPANFHLEDVAVTKPTPSLGFSNLVGGGLSLPEAGLSPFRLGGGGATPNKG